MTPIWITRDYSHVGNSRQAVRDRGRPLTALALLLAVSAIGPNAIAAPGDTLFSDGFEDGDMVPWAVNLGDAGVSSDTSASGAQSMFLGEGTAEVVSPVVDTDHSAVRLSLWIRRGDDSFSEDPDAGEDLQLYYLATGGSYQLLDSFPGDGTPGEAFLRSYDLPANARHAGFRLRVNQTGGQNNADYWHVDDVQLAEPTPPFVGNGTGLTGKYCNRDGSNETDPCVANSDVRRVDATVDYSDGDAGWPASGIGEDTFSVRWTGQIQAQYSESYRLHTFSDDGIRVWLDGELVIDNYADHGETEDISEAIELTRGQKYDLVIEYYENGGNQVARLLWSGPSTALLNSPAVVPQSQLYPVGGLKPNLVAEYRMDEPAWAGTPGEVFDESANGLDGTAVNGPVTADGDPALANNPGTCGYGDFDGANQYVEVADTGALDLQGALTISAWIKPRSLPGSDLMTILSKDRNYEFHVTPSGEINWWWGGGARTLTTSGAGIDPGEWHHVAITYTSGTQKIYVDGVERASGTSTGTLDTNGMPLHIGGDQNLAGRYFDGLIDEVRVYDAAFDADQVGAIRDARHRCSGGVVAWYRLDELAYDGSANEVRDASGAGNHGRTQGSVGSYPPDDNNARVCSGAAIPTNTTSASHAVDTGVDVDDDLGNRGSINFWYRNDRHWRQLPRNLMLFDASDPASGKYFYLAITDATNSGNQANRGARLAFGLEDEDDDDFQFTTSRLNISNRTWVHIGVTWDLPNEQVRIFVSSDDGVTLQQTWTLNGASSTIGELSTLFVGDNRAAYQPVAPMNANSADGRLDEIRVYDRVLNQAAMGIDRDATHPCGADVDHFAIAHDGQAVTCGEEAITITAHNAGHQAFDPGDATTDLVTSTNEGTWARVIAGSGTLSDPTPGDGAASYTWPDNGETEVTLAFNYTSVSALEDPETVNLDVVATPEDPGEDPDLVVSRTAFRILVDGSEAPVPPQIASKPSDAAPGAAALALQAVSASDADPSVCEPYFPDGGDVEVELAAECSDPDTCAGQELRVANNGNTSSIDTSDDDGATVGAASYEAVTLRFGPDSQAPLVLAYHDAGALQFHARYNAIDDGTATPPVVEHVTGAANLVVRPFGFQVEVPNDGAGTGPAGAAPFTAGAEFEVSVTARGWEAADDADDDGAPDAGASLADDGSSDNALLPNFGNEATPEEVALAPAIAAPAGGNPGVLGNGLFGPSDGVPFTAGVASRSDVTWNEVGYVHLDAGLSDGAYLGSGEEVTGRADTVGRFLPFDFDVAARPGAAGVYEVTCNGSFTYIGEPFGYALPPRLDVTARNAAGGATANYRGNFIKLAGSDVSVVRPSVDASAAGVSGDPDIALTTTANAGNVDDTADGDALGNGTVIYTFSSSDTYTYDKVANARVAPFTADLPLDVTGVTDADGVTAGGLPLTVTPAGGPMRFGRLVLDSVVGAEIAPIQMPVRAEHWDGATWVVNEQDSCTALALDADLELDDGSAPVAGDQFFPIGSGQTQITTDPITLNGGLAMAEFIAPGEDNVGGVNVKALTGTAYDYLLGEWEGDDASWDDPPSARIEFGIYSGDDRWIDIRRVQ